MAEQTTAAPDGTATGSPAPVEAGAQTGSAPSQSATEAAGKVAERIAYLETELKKVIGQRDAAKQRFLESDEGKALADKARRAEEYEAKQAEAERKAAEERGEWKQLLERERASWTAKSAEYEAKLSSAIQQQEELARKHKSGLKRAALAEAYQAAGGIDLDAFLTLAAGELDTSVAVGDDGVVKGHGDVVARFIEKRGYLFRNKAAEALESLQKHGVHIEQVPNTMAARDAKVAGPPQPMSLAEYQRQMQGRQTNKPQFPVGKPGG